MPNAYTLGRACILFLCLDGEQANLDKSLQNSDRYSYRFKQHHIIGIAILR